MSTIMRETALRGAFTVEAVFVVTICIWVMMAILYGGMYAHDRVVLVSTVNEMTYSRLAENQKEKTGPWKKRVKSVLEGRLFLMKIQKVKEKKGLAWDTVTVQYTLPISWKFMKKVLSGGKTKLEYKMTREVTKPVEYMWDAAVIRGKTGNEG